ncbi:hypothetical protein DFH09DRAFT_1101010 [Mycena vulgaris]|nr:hypothetical protein DFH09DRAFT_1101010 [Mycena vulgaris]
MDPIRLVDLPLTQIWDIFQPDMKGYIPPRQLEFHPGCDDIEMSYLAALLGVTDASRLIVLEGEDYEQCSPEGRKPSEGLREGLQIFRPRIAPFRKAFRNHDYFYKGGKQNGTHFKNYCKACIKMHMESIGAPMSDLVT